MKILALFNSNISPDDVHIPREEMFPALMVGPLGAAIGEEVEAIPKSVWPDARLAPTVDRWMKETRPELVILSVPGFWFMYESTPVRMERRLGAPGRWLGKQFREIAAKPKLAHNRPFQWGRRQTQRVLGGESWFSAETVIQNITATMLAVLRSESSYLVVFGPSGGERWARDEKHLQELVARREKVDRALEEFCKAHHVEYWGGSRLGSLRDPRGSSLQGDQLHLDREGHKRLAEFQLGLAVAVAKRALAHARGVPSQP